MRRLLGIIGCMITASVMAQSDFPVDSIAPRLTGCWFAGDGGMKGEYCFRATGDVIVRPSGRGRIEIQGLWEVDRKGQVTIHSGKSKTRYLVERLEADGFILVTPKDGVRLEGHKERPKGWK